MVGGQYPWFLLHSARSWREGHRWARDAAKALAAQEEATDVERRANEAALAEVERMRALMAARCGRRPWWRFGRSRGKVKGRPDVTVL